jgi:hypothetical protein
MHLEAAERLTIGLILQYKDVSTMEARVPETIDMGR